MAKDTSDIVEDSLAALGEDQGSGLPTPADIIAAENAAAGGKVGEDDSQGETVQPESGDKEENASVLEGIDIEALEEKVSIGAALTDEETEALKQIEQAVEEPPPVEMPEKSYKIAGKEVAYEEMEDRYVKETGTDISKLTMEAREKNVDMFARVQNREAAHVAVAERQKVVAKETKEIEAEKIRVAEMKRSIEAERKEIEFARTRLAAERKRLEAKAAINITKQDIKDPETGETDYDKLRQYNGKMEAAEQLSELESQEQEISQKERAIESSLVHTILTDFQLSHPQYRTSEDMREVAKKIRSGQAVSAEDEIKVLQMTSMLNDASTMNISLDKVYASRKAVNQILPEVAQPTVPARGAKKPSSPETLAQKIIEYKARLKKNLRLAEGGGAGQRGKATGKTLGQQVMEETKLLLAEDHPQDDFARHVYDSPKR
jgi:hypothetical protein